MFLTQEEEDILAGKRGPGLQKALSLLVKYGDAFGAERLVPVAAAHVWAIDPYEFLKDLTEDVTRAGAPLVTTHPYTGCFDPDTWKDMGVPTDFAMAETELVKKRSPIIKRLNFLPTFTCLPFLVGNFALKGQILSWMGSGVQIMANSLIGARAQREGIVSVLASAITGKTPYMGLLKPENRWAQIVVKLDGINIEKCNEADLQAIGYYIGAKVGDKNIVLEGVPTWFSFEQLKNLMVPLPVSGAVAMCHIAGITPEAPTVQDALGHRKPEEEIIVSKKEIDEVYFEYAGADGEPVPLVVLGCPHLTIGELEQVASLIEGKRVKSRLWVGTAEQILALARRMGYADIIEKAGGVFARCCMAGIPFGQFPEGTNVVATNSIKAAHYISRIGGIKTIFGTTEDCVKAAVAGKWKSRV